MTGRRTYVIAEAGVNHDGSLEQALRLVDAAANAGADAVKFQMFTAGAVAGRSAAKADYQKVATGSGESQLAMLKRLELPQEHFRRLQQHAHRRQLEFLCTPFDSRSLAELLNGLKLVIIKIGSGDLTNAPLLLDAAKGGARIILSTGMGTLAEIEEALGVLAYATSEDGTNPGRQQFAAAWRNPATRQRLAERVTLLHCTTEYPTPYESINLAAMDTMRHAFALPVGFSDHTLGIEMPIAAVARGAVMIEKHLTLDRSLPGPDHAASLEPGDFRRMVDAIRAVELALGDGRKVPQAAEVGNLLIARRSLVANRAIAQGDAFTQDNVTSKRPAGGLSPIHFWDVIGRVAKRDFREDDAIEI